MLTVISNTDNSQTIAIPPDEMEKLGISSGDEVELSKNEKNEIILRSKQEERSQKVLDKTREIIERRRSVLLELGKGHE